MNITWVRASLIVATLLAGLAPATGRAQPSQPAGDLPRALAMAPITASQISFTDRAVLKRYEGASGLTSKSSAQDRLRFILSLTKDQSVAWAYGTETFEGHAAAWGWDSTDLLWEINFQTTSKHTAFVLRFRDDFDFAPVVAHFIKRGFNRNDYHGVPVYSHDLDFTASWATPDAWDLLNTAVLATKRTLVFSPSAEAVRSVLDVARGAAPALTGDPWTPVTVSRLGMMAAAIILPGVDACPDTFSSLLTKGLKDVAKNMQAMVKLLKRLHQYVELGIGYRDEGTRPVGLVVMHFLNAREARADLALRRSLAQNGSSGISGRPYRDVLFTVESAAVTGSDLVLRLHPAGNKPEHLFEMVLERDMLFAACP